MNRGHTEGSKKDVRGATAPTSASSGTLRVVRQGATLHFLAAENGSTEFRRLHQIAFTEEDISGVRVGVHTVDPDVGMEVAWKDLVIRAEQIAGVAGAEQVAGMSGEGVSSDGASQRSSWFWWLFVLFVLLLALGLLWRITGAKKVASD
jgi:hypothetical protein